MKLHNIIFTNICELLYELENKAHHKQLPNVQDKGLIGTLSVKYTFLGTIAQYSHASCSNRSIKTEIYKRQK